MLFTQSDLHINGEVCDLICDENRQSNDYLHSLFFLQLMWPINVTKPLNKWDVFGLALPDNSG